MFSLLFPENSAQFYAGNNVVPRSPSPRSLHLPYKPKKTTFARIFLFLETAGLFACTICYAVQYYTKQHSTTQLNKTHHNITHYTICFLGNLSLPGIKTVLKTERYAQRLTQGYYYNYGRWRLWVMGSRVPQFLPWKNALYIPKRTERAEQFSKMMGAVHITADFFLLLQEKFENSELGHCYE